MALRTLGPAIGFVLAYICLNVYIDPSKTPLIHKKDPRWLGAWWLGWILLGSIMFLFALLISMFPQHLPVTRIKRTPDDDTITQNGYQNNLYSDTKIDVPKFRGD